MTRILSEIESDRGGSTEELIPLVYKELRRLAQARLNHEPAGQTLQATALVHEAYVRLVDSDLQNWENKGHFFAAAAESMRRIMIDRARRKRASKRGGDQVKVDLEKIDVATELASEELLCVDEALERLEQRSGQAAQLVQLRFFAGLSHPEAAKVMGLSERTAKRIWAWARTWLYKEMKAELEHPTVEHSSDARENSS